MNRWLSEAHAVGSWHSWSRGNGAGSILWMDRDNDSIGAQRWKVKDRSPASIRFTTFKNIKVVPVWRDSCLSHFSFLLFRKLPVFFFVCSFLGPRARAAVKRRPSKGYSFSIVKYDFFPERTRQGCGWVRVQRPPWSFTPSSSILFGRRCTLCDECWVRRRSPGCDRSVSKIL